MYSLLGQVVKMGKGLYNFSNRASVFEICIKKKKLAQHVPLYEL